MLEAITEYSTGLTAGHAFFTRTRRICDFEIVLRCLLWPVVTRALLCRA